MWWFPWENSLNPHIIPSTEPFSFKYISMIFFFLFSKDSIPFKIFQIGAVGDLVWRICGKRWGPRRGQLDVSPPICWFQAQMLPLGAKLRISKLGGPYTIPSLKTPPFGASDDPLCKIPYIHCIYRFWASLQMSHRWTTLQKLAHSVLRILVFSGNVFKTCGVLRITVLDVFLDFRGGSFPQFIYTRCLMGCVRVRVEVKG